MPRRHSNERSAGPPLSWRERGLVSGILLTIAWTTWAAANRNAWVEWGTFFLSLVTLGLLIAPHQRHEGPRWSGLKQLLRFPPFWTGLLLIVYCAIQALNPRFIMLDVGGGQMSPLRMDFISWLPSTVQAPWWTPNAWRLLLVLSAAWMLLCVASTGLRRRRSVHILLWGIAINCTLFAVALIIQKQLNLPEILWMERNHPLQRLWVFFGNPNHAGAMLNLGLAATLGLFLHLTASARNPITRGGPHLMLLPMAGILATAALMTYSRAAIGVAIVQLIVALFLGFARLFKHLREHGNRGSGLALTGVLVLLAAVGIYGLGRNIDQRTLQRQIDSIFQIVEGEEDVRVYLNRATWELIEERPWFGWGLGSYRYFIPVKQQNYPELMFKRSGQTAQIVYAHNEWLQYLAELGIIGYVLLLATVLYPPLAALRHLRAVDAGMLALAAGLLLLAANAWVEFFFQRPRLILQYALLIALLARLVTLSARRRRLESDPAFRQ